MKQQQMGDCRLNKNDANAFNACTASACRGCGWEAKEALRRRTQIRENGLTMCQDGLLRLKLGKKRKQHRELKEAVDHENKKHCSPMQKEQTCRPA